MPPVIGALFGGASFATIVTSIFLTVFINYAAYVLAPRPKRPRFGFDRKDTVRDPLAPKRICYGRSRVGGVIAFMEAAGGVYLDVIIILASHRIKSIGAMYFDGVEVTQTASGAGFVPDVGDTFEGVVYWEKKLGTHTTTFTQLESESTNWTTDHKLLGLAHVWVRLTNSAQHFPNGAPNITFDIEGKDDIWDPRTSTNVYTENLALCWGDYVANSYGVGAGLAGIDEDDWIPEANICDELVPLDAGGDEPRYTCNGVLTADLSRSENLQSLLTGCGGTMMNVGGKWRLRTAAWRAPTIELTEDDWVGPLSVQSRLSRREQANAVKGVFVSPDEGWDPVDYPPVTNSTYQTQDGEQIFRELHLPMTVSSPTAQRLAKIELERARQQITFSGTAKLSAYRLQPGDVVNVTHARFGWSSKPFEIMEMGLNQGEKGLALDMVFRETASGVFDWNSGEETTIDLAPDTDLPNVHQVPEPENLVLTSDATTSLQLQDGNVVPRIKADWDPPSTAHPHLSHYELVWFETTLPGAVKLRRELPTTPEGGTEPETEAFVEGVTDGVQYTVKVRSVSRHGVVSRFIQTNVTVSTRNVVGDPTNLLYGGDYNRGGDPLNQGRGGDWNLTSTSYSELNPDAESEAEWTDVANAWDDNEGTFATAAPSAGSTLTAIYTFPGTGAIEGFVRVKGKADVNPQGACGVSVSFDAGSNYTFIGSLKSPRLKTLLSQFGTPNREDIRVKLEASRITGAASGGFSQLAEVDFMYVGASGILASVGNFQGAVRGDGVDYGEVWRGFPGGRPDDNVVVFKAGNNRGVFKIWAMAESTPDFPLEVLLRDPASETTWGAVTVDEARIPTSGWRAFADLFEPVTDVVGELEYVVRTKSTIRINFRKSRVTRGNRLWSGWMPSAEELGYQGDQSAGEETGFPATPFTPGTPLESEVA